jgi:hypothetical protein
MRCRYCFDTINDRTKPCPHCGSRQPVIVGGVEVDPGAGIGGGSLSLTRRQIRTAVIAALLIAACLLFGLTALIRPGALPPSIVAALNLGTPIPTNTPQVTRATIATPTPLTLQTHTNSRVGFQISFPSNWLVVNQAVFGWPDDVEDLGEEYSWAATLFQTGEGGTVARSRAVDPNVVDVDTGELVVFTVGSASDILDTLEYSQIPQLAAENPQALSELAGPLIGGDFTTRRTAALRVNGLPATLVEFTSRSEIFEEAVQLRVRLYFVEGPNDVYVVGYFAEEQLAIRSQRLYEDIVQSFEILE